MARQALPLSTGLLCEMGVMVVLPSEGLNKLVPAGLGIAIQRGHWRKRGNVCMGTLQEQSTLAQTPGKGPRRASTLSTEQLGGQRGGGGVKSGHRGLREGRGVACSDVDFCRAMVASGWSGPREEAGTPAGQGGRRSLRW